MEGQDNYIFLQEATKYCNYSQEYLSLRARQGRLKSVKVGRKWATKLEWLEDYLNRADDYNQKIQEIREKKLLNAKSNFRLKLGRPPLNLPIEREPIGVDILVISLIMVFLFSVCLLNKESFKQALKDISPAISEINQGINLGISQYLPNAQTASIGTITKEYSQWIVNNYNQANDYLEKNLGGFLGEVKSIIMIRLGLSRICKNWIEGYSFVNDSLENRYKRIGDFFSNLLPSPKAVTTNVQEEKKPYSFGAINNFFKGFSGWLETSLDNSGKFSSIIIKGGLEKLGLNLENGKASLEELDVKQVIANQGKFKKIEMIDKNNGKIYCLEIEKGNWVKTEGECKSD